MNHHRISFVMDAEIVSIGNLNYVQEISYANLHTRETTLQHVELPLQFSQLTPHDQLDVLYKTHYMNGISYKNFIADTDYTTFVSTLSRVINYSNDSQTFIACKSGPYDHEILKEYGAEFILDLGKLRTPTLERIVNNPLYRTYASSFQHCPPNNQTPLCSHLPLVHHQPAYCSITAVIYFSSWLLTHLSSNKY